MKLLDKLNIRYIGYSLIAMTISGILIYAVISMVVNKQLDEKLKLISIGIDQKLANNEDVNSIQPFVEINETEPAPEILSISDTTILNKIEEEFEVFRQLSSARKINGKFYRIVIRESKLESEDLVATLAIITLLSMLLLTGSLILINRKVAKSIWAPFYKNLKTIEAFSLLGSSPVQLQETGITEFDNLNNVVTRLTRQINTDYQNLRQFSEDASHEIQTPLAIISAKFESLLDDQDLNEHQLNAIQSAYLSVQRLSKLNKELLLLTKIGNNQFPEVEKIDLKKVIQDKLVEFQELLELKGIAVESELSEEFAVISNSVLLDIMISNLFSNSINHNISGGIIRIIQNEQSLEIRNTGKSLIKHPEKLFQRFYKENPSEKSVGLGLAVVAKICEVQGWQISYSFIKPLHGFRVSFAP